MDDITIGFIGLGFIGGSIAKTIHRLHPEYIQIAYDLDEKSLALAKSEGVLNNYYLDISSDFKSCDFVFLCAPVSTNCQNLNFLKPLLKPSCILTDVGSVKTNIHKAISESGLEKMFIGGHPMAGSEKTGYENASGYLLENVFYILTPSSNTPDSKIELYQKLIASLGAIPIILSAKDHDNVTAHISHLPHVIASSLVNFIQESDSDEHYMKLLSAGGFKDMTRIASSSPTMWQQICTANKPQLVSSLKHYIKYLKKITTIIESNDAKEIFDFFQNAREYRNSFSSSHSGPLNRSYEVYCDIKDETGQLATLATLLAKNNISIKNIGIIHNREFEQGVVRIEFYNEYSTQHAIEILKNFKYTIYVRS